MNNRENTAVIEFFNGPAEGEGQVSLDGDGDFWRHYLTDDGDEYELREDEDGKLYYLYVP